MPHIKVIDYEESEGKLREVYDGLLKSRGKLADIHKIQSLLPETITNHISLYMDIMFQQKSLDREMNLPAASAKGETRLRVEDFCIFY